MVGHNVDLSFAYDHLGEETSVLKELADGTHPFCQVTSWDAIFRLGAPPEGALISDLGRFSLLFYSSGGFHLKRSPPPGPSAGLVSSQAPGSGRR